MVAPSLVIVTSPRESLIILSIPLGPSDVLITSATANYNSPRAAVILVDLTDFCFSEVFSNPPPVLIFIIMAKHHPDLIMCRKQPGIAIGRLCDKCDGRCVICDSYVRPNALVRVCDECNFGSNEGRCVVCGAPGISDAYYCRECSMLEKDRDGCPKIINLGTAKTDQFYERKKYGFKRR